jgi:hypothetical protein
MTSDLRLEALYKKKLPMSSPPEKPLKEKRFKPANSIISPRSSTVLDVSP